MIAISHMWLLNTSNVASVTEELTSFYLIVINLNLNLIEYITSHLPY